jgi:NAD(P)-dependent dehydrogenase (short-subunit alcohol dehydrogenase family)
VEPAQRGFDLLLHHRSSHEDAERTAEACRAHGATVRSVSADLATVEGCDTLIDGARAAFDQVHLLVNNASAFYAVPFENIDAAEWDRMLAVNTRAPFLGCCRCCARPTVLRSVPPPASTASWCTWWTSEPTARCKATRTTRSARPGWRCS